MFDRVTIETIIKLMSYLLIPVFVIIVLDFVYKRYVGTNKKGMMNTNLKLWQVVLGVFIVAGLLQILFWAYLIIFVKCIPIFGSCT